MEQGTAPAAMAEDLDGEISMPGKGQAIGHHQDDQTNLMVTDGYGMTSDDYQSDLDRVAAVPLPMDDEYDFENFQGDSDVEIIMEDGQETLESHKIDPDVLTAGQQVSGTLENASQSSDADLIDVTMRQARENLAGASSSQVLQSAYSEHAATKPRQEPGSEPAGHSHLGGPAQAGPQGASGIDGTKQKTVGTNNMAASMANDDRVAPGTWQDVAERMVLVTLPARGRPYKRPDLEDAVIRTKFPPNMIETFGEFERNFKYQMTFKTRQQAEAFCMRNEKITVCNDKGQIECPISMFKRREYRIRVSWYPDAGRNEDLQAALGTWGQVLGVHKEKVNGNLGRYNSGARIVTIIPARDIEEVPDFLDINTMARIFTVRLTVKGLPNRCHKCHKRGHLQRDCTACQRCHSHDHATADHPQDKRPAFSALFNRIRPRIEFNEGEDDSEIAMEDVGAGAVANELQSAASASTMETSVQQGSVKRPASSSNMQNQRKIASAANGAGLVTDETSQEGDWTLVEKKAKMPKVATVINSIKQTLSTPIRAARHIPAPVGNCGTPRAGQSTPRRAHAGCKEPVTPGVVPKVGMPGVLPRTPSQTGHARGGGNRMRGSSGGHRGGGGGGLQSEISPAPPLIDFKDFDIYF